MYTRFLTKEVELGIRSYAGACDHKRNPQAVLKRDELSKGKPMVAQVVAVIAREDDVPALR
jgi:hypothetical protein